MDIEDLTKLQRDISKFEKIRIPDGMNEDKYQRAINITKELIEGEIKRKWENLAKH